MPTLCYVNVYDPTQFRKRKRQLAGQIGVHSMYACVPSNRTAAFHVTDFFSRSTYASATFLHEMSYIAHSHFFERIIFSSLVEHLKVPFSAEVRTNQPPNDWQKSQPRCGVAQKALANAQRYCGFAPAGLPAILSAGAQKALFSPRWAAKSRYFPQAENIPFRIKRLRARHLSLVRSQITSACRLRSAWAHRPRAPAGPMIAAPAVTPSAFGQKRTLAREPTPYVFELP